MSLEPKEKNNHWRRLRSEAGPDLKLFRARFDWMENPRNGKAERMIILESPDSVNVVAVTGDDHILFVRQYRFGTREYTLELPGGIVDPGESPREAAGRELREETGYSAQNWEPLGRIGSNPVFMDCYIHHWLARDLSLTHDLNLDDGEEIELTAIPTATVKTMLLRDQFQHPHTISALLRYFAASFSSTD